MLAKKSNRSSEYQYKIVEIAIDPSVLNDFALDTGLGAQINLASHSEEHYELIQELIDEIMIMIATNLTKRQSEVMILTLEGKTQVQIAEQLQIHQTTVHKLKSGNIDYSNGKKRYGGAIKKLKKMCDKNERVLLILQKIKDLQNSDLLDIT